MLIEVEFAQRHNIKTESVRNLLLSAAAVWKSQGLDARNLQLDLEGEGSYTRFCAEQWTQIKTRRFSTNTRPCKFVVFGTQSRVTL